VIPQVAEGKVLESARQLAQQVKDGKADFSWKPVDTNALSFLPAGAPDSPEFKKWFGESKITTRGGKPLVVYHGTHDNFNVFKGNSGDGLNPFENGHFFTADRERAENFGDRIISAHLSIQKPFVIRNHSDWLKLGDQHNPEAWLKKEGYDGAIIKTGMNGDEYVAFDSRQIKSVDNRGTYDPKDPDIRFLPSGSEDLDSRPLSGDSQRIQDSRHSPVATPRKRESAGSPFDSEE
jgi:ADP-Ribosyltransferase in polyvalent proteins